MKKIMMSRALVATLAVSSLTACGQTSDSYGDACPILRVNSTSMAMVVASVPTAVDYETRIEYIQRALATVGANSVQELKMKWNADMNSVLGFSGSLKPPTGSKYKLIEDLRANVWKWDWTSVSDSAEVEEIMSGFADIDESCSN
jgi:hypothetical protein